jgi:CRISPR-associated endonuclease Cas3-HD
MEKFEVIYPVFAETLKRVFAIAKSEKIKEYLQQMILFHDLGKLTQKWQNNLGRGKLPSHAPVGACYLWKSMPVVSDLKEAIVFAVSIHHTDSGLLGSNIEKPDVQAILDGIVEHSGEIIWDKKVKDLSTTYFPAPAETLSVYDLKDMARGLRLWSKGESILKQHRRRLQATLVHHILKLCDISAAIERKEFKESDDYFSGWRMVKDIKEYVDNLNKRLET